MTFARSCSARESEGRKGEKSSCRLVSIAASVSSSVSFNMPRGVGVLSVYETLRRGLGLAG